MVVRLWFVCVHTNLCNGAFCSSVCITCNAEPVRHHSQESQILSYLSFIFFIDDYSFNSIIVLDLLAEGHQVRIKR